MLMGLHLALTLALAHITPNQEQTLEVVTERTANWLPFHSMFNVVSLVITLSLCSLNLTDGFVILSCSGFVQRVTEWLDAATIEWINLEYPQEVVESHGQPKEGRLIGLMHASNRRRRQQQQQVEDHHHELDHQPSVALHVIPTPRGNDDCLVPTFAKRLTEWTLGNSTSPDFPNRIIHLHEDVWYNKNEIVCARLQAQLGRSRRLFARKTVPQRINATYAMNFLNHHHLWGATKAKYYYGLLDAKTHQLMAVASFSSRRKVTRNGHAHRSHELLRYCAQRDMNVVGGITKLLKAFVRDHAPDDIVTVVDRDWGDGSGWHSIGFETVAVLPPVAMAVNPQEQGVRRHLVGAGIRPAANSTKTSATAAAGGGRLGLPEHVQQELMCMTSAAQSRICLAEHGFYTVHDSGVERLFHVVSEQSLIADDETAGADVRGSRLSMTELWNRSKPTYVTKFYSDSPGILALLTEADDAVDSTG